MLSFRAVAAWAVVLVAFAGCGTARNADQHTSTVAILRAVPGTGVEEAAMFDELRQAGFVPGRNLRVFARDPSLVYADPDLARDEIEKWRAEGVDLIVALSSAGAVLARDGAPDADVLFASNDPVATGLVLDEAAPDGRMTGFAFRVPGDRIIDIARRTIPHLSQIGLAYPRDDPAALANRDVLRSAADEFGVTLIDEPFDDEAGVRSAVAVLADQGVDALVVSSSPIALQLLEALQEEALEHRLPVVASAGIADFAVASLAPDSEEMGRQLGRQAARLLSGTPAHAIPVEGPRRFVLRLNGTVAAELGIEIPDDLMREAQDVS